MKIIKNWPEYTNVLNVDQSRYFKYFEVSM